MTFLGIKPMLVGDWIGIACFVSGALFFGAPWWIAIPVGVLAWRAFA